jgi:hypothetical protein
MSIAGICYAVARAPKVIPPSAVASVLLRIPLMKQVIYMYHILYYIRVSAVFALVCYIREHFRHSSCTVQMLVLAMSIFATL